MATNDVLHHTTTSDHSNALTGRLSAHDLKRSLADLPDLVLERILDFLLTAKDVRDTSLTPGHNSHIRYNFSTSIMRVNKGFHTLAKPIFERNHFVLVSCSPPHMMTLSNTLRDHCIWFRGGSVSCGVDHDAQRRIARFKDYHLRLEIAPFTSPARRARLPVEYVMVCLDNLDDLVRALRLIDTVVDQIYSLNFDFKRNSNGTPLNLHVQKALLQPFVKLQGRGKHYDGQRASIVGAVDEALAQDYQKLLSPCIHWQRQRIWEMFEMMLWKKNVADRSFESGDIWSAHDQYLNFRDYYGYMAHPRHHELTASDDMNIRRSATRLIALLQINFHMICLLLEDDCGYDEERASLLQAVCADSHVIAEESYLTPNEVAVNDVLCGIANLIQDTLVPAQEFFKTAVELDPGVKAYSGCLSAANDLLAGVVPKTSIRSIVSQLMKSLTDSKFFKPLKCSRWKAKSVIKSADVERHELKRLGYTGDLLHDLIKQKKGWTVDRDTHEPINEPFNPSMVDAALDDIVCQAFEEERTSGKRHQTTVMMPRRHPSENPAAPTANANASNAAGASVAGPWDDEGAFYLDLMDETFSLDDFTGPGEDDDLLDDPWLPPAMFSAFGQSMGGIMGGVIAMPGLDPFQGPGPVNTAASTFPPAGGTGAGSDYAVTAISATNQATAASQNDTTPTASTHGATAQGIGQQAQPPVSFQTFAFPPFQFTMGQGTAATTGAFPVHPAPTTTAASQAGPAQAGTPQNNVPPAMHFQPIFLQAQSSNNQNATPAHNPHAQGGPGHGPAMPPGGAAQPGMGHGEGHAQGQQQPLLLPPNCQQM